MQFTLKDILLGTTAVTVSCTALTFASWFWATLYFTGAMTMLLTAVVFSCVSREAQRAYWVGFAVFGWGYFIILHSTWLDTETQVQNWRLFSDGPLFTSAILDWLYSNVLSLIHPQPQTDGFGQPIPGTSSYPLGPNFARVGHSIFALLFALLGGEIGRRGFQGLAAKTTDVSETVTDE